MRKFKVTILCLILLFTGMPGFHTLDLPFEGNETEWKNFCLQDDLSKEDKQSCKDYMRFVSQQSLDLEAEINKINKELDAVQHSIEQQLELIAKYQVQIDEFNGKIEQLQLVIDERTVQIIAKEKEISDMEAEIATLNKKIRERMVSLQKTMKFNNSFDFLMGAENFEDLIARINGLSIMERYDEDLKDKLKGLLAELNEAKALLEEQKKALEDDKAIVERSKSAVDELLVKAENAKTEYMKLKAELEAKGNKLATNLDSLNSTLKELESAISDVVTSNGFVRPVVGGSISAGTWAYETGGVHLGMDFANSLGTPLRAIANGVVVYSTDGCGYGYLGNLCTGEPMGTTGGGNQVYLICSANGSIYGVKYIHILKGTVAKEGTIVHAGDTIGLLGSSGNSSGPHLHLEITYLGEGNLYSFVESWLEEGSLSFGAGFGYSALERLCENGVGAPCRERPEKYFS